MGERKNKVKDIDSTGSEYMTMDQLRREMIPWSIDTIKRRIENDGFPAIKIAGKNGYLFDRKQVREWMKRREFKAG